MTDEEMAENYAKSIVIFDRDFHNERFAELEQAYLAGLKAGRQKWHNLQKDPTDVPKENVTVLLLTEVEPVTTRYDNEYESFFRLGDK